MMFRYGKIIESNSKTSRSDRFAEMSKQQQLIESKKQEIKAKFEERKRQEAEEATKISSKKNASEHRSSKDHKSLLSSRMQSWKNDDRWRKKQRNSEQNESKTSNLFSNDGSFLEKYRKIASVQPEEKSENESISEHQTNIMDDDISLSSRMEENRQFLASRNIDTSIPPHAAFDASCRDGIPYPPPNMMPSSMSVTSQQQSLYSLTSRPPPTAPPTSIHTSLAAVPASVPLLTAVPSSGASLQTVSLIQVPVSVSASSVILSCPLETTLVTSEPVVHLPVVRSTLPPNSITVPLQTTVIPAQIQITSQAAVPQSSVQTVQINQSSTNVILSQTLQPQSILVPSECIHSQPPPSVYSTMNNTSMNYSMSQPSQEPALPPVHLPPPNYPPILSASHRQESIRSVSNLSYVNCKTSQFCNEKDGYGNERSLITSESNDHRYQNMRSSEIPERRYGSRGLEELETVARMVADCGDDMENILLNRYPDDEKLWFLKDKLSPPYIAFRNMVEKIRRDRSNDNEKSFNRSTDEKPYSKVPADEDDSDGGDDNEERRRRKRKRRSRWAPENDKVNIPPVVVPTNPPPNMNVPPPTGNLGIIPVAPPTQDRKLAGISGPIISQVTRTDPALLQYALKSFGTINLSEEDWKKAEDHYKINLLYQDMLKKRQELERLQAAGKHKYAYDSDEDTEGGTWEHKLRQQEMVATQLWADELTERAKGKHHIGDFLPPDELERFMEKYNALKQGREPDLSDYKEFKLKEDNIGFQMLQKLGWSEGQGLGSEGTGIVNPVNKAPSYALSHGLGVEKPDDISRNDDEYDAYRKRMMLAYRFRPNPLNNPRRPYY